MAAAALVCAGAGSAQPAAWVDWPSWGGTPANTRYAGLTQVDAADVSRLRLAWTRGEGPEQFAWETFPVVVGTTMYFSTDTDGVVAVDAATGRLRWSYVPLVDLAADPEQDLGEPVSRGVTVAAGRVYDLTADDQLIALNARDGRVVWDVRIDNARAGYSENSPVAYWRGELILGGPAGDASLRGFVAAYSARSGRRLWRTEVGPAGRDAAGGDVWMTPTVDASTGTVYAATGNPTPAFTDAGRRGCLHWSDATVALDARTGRLEWGHDELCDDVWDYDTDQSPVLFDVSSHGRRVAAVGDGSKAGFYSILDAHTGALIARSPRLTRYSRPHRDPTTAGSIVCPGTFGGLEYAPPAFSPSTQAIYVVGSNLCTRYTLAPDAPRSADLDGTAVQTGPAGGVIAAVDTRTGRVDWREGCPSRPPAACWPRPVGWSSPAMTTAISTPSTTARAPWSGARPATALRLGPARLRDRRRRVHRRGGRRLSPGRARKRPGRGPHLRVPATVSQARRRGGVPRVSHRGAQPPGPPAHGRSAPHGRRRSWRTPRRPRRARSAD